MSSKKKIYHQHTRNISTVMNIGTLGGNPLRDKTTLVVVIVFLLLKIKNFLQSCTSADSYQYAGTHLQKAATFSHSPTPARRELHPLISFTDSYRKGSPTPSTNFLATTGRKL